MRYASLAISPQPISTSEPFRMVERSPTCSTMVRYGLITIRSATLLALPAARTRRRWRSMPAHSGLAAGRCSRRSYTSWRTSTAPRVATTGEPKKQFSIAGWGAAANAAARTIHSRLMTRELVADRGAQCWFYCAVEYRYRGRSMMNFSDQAKVLVLTAALFMSGSSFACRCVEPGWPVTTSGLPPCSWAPWSASKRVQSKESPRHFECQKRGKNIWVLKSMSPPKREPVLRP